MKLTKTLKVRIKDKSAKQLSQMARSVNFVWNYVNELSERSIRERGVFLSAYDMHPYTKGAGKELGLHCSTLQQIAGEYVSRRNQFKKARLKWRKSGGRRRSLGWIPCAKGSTKWLDGRIYHYGKLYDIWDSYDLSKYQFRSSCFCEDSRGRWYFCVAVDVDIKQSTEQASVGIDLGCKDSATASSGLTVRGRRYRELESKLGIAQRAKNKYQVKTINAKIKNRRADDLHKFSRKLVNENAAIFVGNVSSTKLVKTKMAKSVLDAGWGLLKNMLEYKCEHAGVVFEVVNEAYTTQTCSRCGVIPSSSPKGRAGLGIREWTCECGVTHDRDVNAAMNILALGHQRLAGGIAI